MQKLKELIRLIPGPDFPTGGLILGKRGIVEAYESGRGRLTVRGLVHLEGEEGERRQRLGETGLIRHAGRH